MAQHASYQAWLASLPDYQGQIAAMGFYPERAAVTVPDYQGPFVELLERLEIRPYRHQAEALEQIGAGAHVVLASPTASGKSLGYQLPTLAALEQGATSLYLFPTKALAVDQLEKLTALAEAAGVAGMIGTYDGDTPAARRKKMREQAGCLLSNPDMLHFGILPHHQRWAPFLGRLRYLVIDELHSYRGVMGAHVANIIRRLLRLARHYGAAPQLIAASATIGNPAAHARALTGLEAHVISGDDAPRSARELLFWQPPALPGSDGRRRSANTEAAYLAAAFVRAGLKAIFFCNSRKSAELLRRYAAAQLTADESVRLQSYRAGYTAADRRLIEAGFKNGDITVLTATSALELGVDIGGVDAVVLVGYPGSQMALWQRVGRAGRAGKRSLALLIPGNDPLDEYFLHHPDLILDGHVEDAVADPFNSEIHPRHVACAAAELPIRDDEGFLSPWFDPASVPRLRRHQDAWHYPGRYPHRRVSIRGTGGKRIRLVDGFDNVLGESDLATALRELHPGAVYLHQGEPFLVMALDLDEGRAVLAPHIEEYYTQARSETDIEVLEVDSVWPGVQVGRVRVTTAVTGFVKKRYFTEAVIDERLLDLPEVSYPTQALWFGVEAVRRAVSAAALPAAMHALEHTLIGLLPAFVLCERADVGGVSYPLYPPLAEPVVFIYDGYPGGVGYARAGASLFRDWLEAAHQLLGDCPCRSGCPRCTLSPKCGNGNQFLDKAAARALAGALLERLGGPAEAMAS